jgi:hypothetical protein
VGLKEIIMAMTIVGIYRSHRERVPIDEIDQPLPETEWRPNRPFSLMAHWFSGDGNRFSKSFEARKEAERFA